MRRKGSVLLIVLILALIIFAVSLSVSKFITLNFKSLSYEKLETLHFLGAEGGIYAVSGWMYFYKRVDIPKEVAHTDSYDVKVNILKNTIRYPVGYASLWKGFDVKLNSYSNETEIEAVVFVPVAPVGYGNE